MANDTIKVEWNCRECSEHATTFTGPDADNAAAVLFSVMNAEHNVTITRNGQDITNLFRMMKGL